jgi:hypothetical protein
LLLAKLAPCHSDLDQKSKDSTQPSIVIALVPAIVDPIEPDLP